jgi:hypothetical protein|tara:strand:- start:27 stop:212 length:186 start_codon:yes stop_codon:yes gene_type:complete
MMPKDQLRQETLSILLKEFGSSHSSKGIYECADEWTARQPTTSGLVSYFKAYYNKYINTTP